MQVLEEEKTKLDAFCEQSLKTVRLIVQVLMINYYSLIQKHIIPNCHEREYAVKSL